MASLSFPLFVTYGAGVPDLVNDIDAMVAAGAAGLRMGIDWRAATTTTANDDITFNTSYVNKIATVIKHCNSRTLLSGVVSVPGVSGLAVDLQIAIGSKYSAQGFNENANGFNVPKGIAVFGAKVIDFFKAGNGNGDVWAFELGNEPNHVKWDDYTLGSGVLAAGKGLAYVKCLALWSGLARAADPTAILVLGGLGGHADSASDVPPDEFYQQMYDARFTSGGYTVGGTTYNAPKGVHGLIDRANFHPYCYYNTPTEDLAGQISGHSGWKVMVERLQPILQSGGGHADATDASMPIIITEFGQPNPNGGHSITDAANVLIDACTHWNDPTENPNGGAVGGVLCWFCWQDKDETVLPACTCGATGCPRKCRWYGLVGVGNNQWVGDTTPFGPKDPLYTTFKSLSTTGLSGGGGSVPTISSIVTSPATTPPSGPAAGGTVVTVNGTHLGAVTGVKFGTTTASFTLGTNLMLTATSPAGTGTVDVICTNANGPNVTGAADQFTYNAVAGAPTVTALSPDNGAAAGGTSVTITGTNLGAVTAVKFGTTAATSFTLGSATSMTAVSPAGTGTARVKVTNATGTSTANPPFDTYRYNSPSTGGGWGINVSATYTYATAVANRAKALWTAAGSTDERIVRVQPEWGGAQPGSFAGTTPGQNDTFDWGHINPIIDAQAAAGNKILWIIGYTPADLIQTAVGKGDKCFPNRDAPAAGTNNAYRDVANYAWALVDHAERRSSGVTKAIEVWNEPSGTFLYPVSVKKYTAMLVAVYKAVKTGVIDDRTDNPRTAYSSILVGTAGISPERPGTSNDAANWHQGIIANGGTNSFDWAGHHPYGLECPPTNVASWNQRLHVLPQLRNKLDAANRQDAEIWITEDGSFNRPNGTNNNPNDGACGTKGLGDDAGLTAAERANYTHEVTEAMCGQRITELAAWYQAKKATYNLGVLTYYEMEDGKDNDALNSDGSPDTSAWADHAGMYARANAHNGVVKADVHDAFVAALGTGPTRTAPACNISSPPDDPTHATPLSGSVLFLIPSSDTVDTQSSLTVRLYRANGSTLIGDASWSALSGWFYLLDSTTLTDGDYVFAAKCTNSNGQTTTSNLPNGVRARITNGANPTPTVSSVVNNATGLASGDVAGGDAVTVRGTSFTGTTGVTVGGTAATSVAVAADGLSLTCVTPAHAAGTVNTKVTNASGTSAVVPEDRFTYTSVGVGGSPTVTSVSPSRGSIAGGDTIQIGGTNFTGTTAVAFGATAATAFTVGGGGTLITATNPSTATAGPVDVRVTNATGQSGIDPRDAFTYTTTAPGMSCTILAITNAQGQTFDAPIPQPLTVDATVTLAVQVNNPVGNPVVEIWEGTTLPYGPNFLGTATAAYGVYLYQIDTTLLTNHANHTIRAVPTDGSGSAGLPS